MPLYPSTVAAADALESKIQAHGMLDRAKKLPHGTHIDAVREHGFYEWDSPAGLPAYYSNGVHGWARVQVIRHALSDMWGTQIITLFAGALGDNMLFARNFADGGGSPVFSELVRLDSGRPVLNDVWTGSSASAISLPYATFIPGRYLVKVSVNGYGSHRINIDLTELGYINTNYGSAVTAMSLNQMVYVGVRIWGSDSIAFDARYKNLGDSAQMPMAYIERIARFC